MKQVSMITALLLLLQSTVHSQQQVQKGRWLIGHTVGGFYYQHQHATQYTGGLLDMEWKNNNTGFQLDLTGPDWGDIQAGTRKYVIMTNDYASKNKDLNIYFKPTVGYFIKDNLLIGVTIYVNIEAESGTASNTDAKQTGKSFGLGAGPMMRYYFGKGKKRKPFVGFESIASFTNYNYRNTDTQGGVDILSKTKEENKVYEIKPFAGYGWFLGRHWTIELRADYAYYKYDNKRVSHYYEDHMLQAGYPVYTSYKSTVSRLAINAGVSFTF